MGQSFRAPRRLLLLLSPLALVACSTMDLPDAPKTIVTPNPHYKIGAPYRIDGRWYTPKIDERYDEEGLASWYGDDFHGRLTANGEVFDKRRLSAAHKTLPMPTLVEVENLENGRRVMVRVNDRGPFVGDRVIDLSRAAADELGFASRGLARVRVRYLGEADMRRLAAMPGDPAPTSLTADPLAGLIAEATEDAPAPAGPDIWVELAAVESLDALETMNLDVPDLGPITVKSGDRLQFVRIGPFIDEAIAFASLSRVKAAGFPEARIVRGAGL